MSKGHNYTALSIIQSCTFSPLSLASANTTISAKDIPTLTGRCTASTILMGTSRVYASFAVTDLPVTKATGTRAEATATGKKLEVGFDGFVDVYVQTVEGAAVKTDVPVVSTSTSKDAAPMVTAWVGGVLAAAAVGVLAV